MTLLRRHGLWLVIAMMVGIAGAWLFYASQPHVFQSTAQVDVEQNPAVTGTQVVPNMATEQQVATSGEIAARTATSLGVPAQSIAGHLSAKVTSTANVLSISCAMATPVTAQRCAAAAAAAYVAFRNDSAGTTAQQAHDLLHVTLVTPATLPAKPAGPGKRILLPIGAILGLALGFGGIVIRDHFDDRVRDRADLERWLEAPVLAAIPRMRRRAADPAFVFSRAPRSKAAEAYRYLRYRLGPYLASAWSGGTVLLVASPDGLEGRTCVAANLARALAQAGTSVLLVDADLRYPRRDGPLGAPPSLSNVFRTGKRPGLTELLAGTVSLDEVAYPAEMPRLRFVAAGGAADRGADSFAVANLAGIFSDMRACADVVVVDSPPALAVSDAISLAHASDVVLMVADARRTGRSAVSAAVQEIQATGPSVVVGVLNAQRPLANRRALATAQHEPETPGLSGYGPAASADVAAANGRNGKRPAQLGATSTGQYGRRGPAVSTDNPTQPFGRPGPAASADDPPGPGAASR